MISVIEAGQNSSVKIYLGKNVHADGDTTDVQIDHNNDGDLNIRDLTKLINTLRAIATRYNVMPSIKKFNKILEPKDFAYQSVHESWKGTSKSSYQKIANTRLIVRHTGRVNEESFNSRTRNIQAIFLETSNGERFRFPTNQLLGGRAMACHLNYGKNNDITARKIVELSLEHQSLKQFKKSIRSDRLVGDGINGIKNALNDRLLEIKKSLGKIAKPTSYSSAIKNIPTLSGKFCENKLQELTEMFRESTYDNLSEVLNRVAILTGERMTNNNFYHVSIRPKDANALIESLNGEYGHSDDDYSIFDESNLYFTNESTFKDAVEYLNILEARYKIVESDPFTSYSQSWTENRFRKSGETGQMSDEANSGIEVLADGLRKIFHNDFRIPDFPEHAPKFTDSLGQDAFYLSLYVEQNVFENPVVSNYISSIVDKMDSNVPLDNAEKIVKNRLVKALEEDLAESLDPEMDECDNEIVEDQWDDIVVDGKKKAIIDDIMNNFNVKIFLDDHADLDDGPIMEDDFRHALVLFVLDQMGKERISLEHDELEQIVDKLLGELLECAEDNGIEVQPSRSNELELAEEFNADKEPEFRWKIGDNIVIDSREDLTGVEIPNGIKCKIEEFDPMKEWNPRVGGPVMIVAIDDNGDDYLVDTDMIKIVDGDHVNNENTEYEDDKEIIDELESFHNTKEEQELAEWFKEFNPDRVLELTTCRMILRSK
jgi:hypothetical protein